VHALYTQILAATKNNKIKWIQSGGGLFSAGFPSGSVTISRPVSDQRDGDYCVFTVYGSENKMVAETTVGTELWTLANTQPANNVIANLLTEIESL
jgi:hypothetical protein